MRQRRAKASCFALQQHSAPGFAVSMIIHKIEPARGELGIEDLGTLIAIFSWPRFEREIHHEPRRRCRAVVHETEKETGGDLANFVAVVFINTRSLAVVENQRRLAVEPARPLINLGPDNCACQKSG